MRVSQPQFLYLKTKGWKTGRQHEIEIWFVNYDGKYYIVSEHREQSHWVKNVLRNPGISFSVTGRRFEGTARVVKEPDLIAAVSKLMDAKYGWSDGLIVELAPKNL
ncbi:MAG: nitroreductase/quinone reductase family protein [Nitrososphaera sp.]